jgi:hypothetical protein
MRDSRTTGDADLRLRDFGRRPASGMSRVPNPKVPQARYAAARPRSKQIQRPLSRRRLMGRVDLRQILRRQRDVDRGGVFPDMLRIRYFLNRNHMGKPQSR